MNLTWKNSLVGAIIYTLDRFIFSLGIRFIGQVAAELLADYYVSYDNWYNSMIELSSDNTELVSIDGIGKKVAESLESFFSKEHNIKMLNDLTAYLQILPVSSNSSDSVLNNKIIVFTGKLLAMSRGEAKVRAKTLGAKVSSHLSAKTDYVKLILIHTSSRIYSSRTFVPHTLSFLHSSPYCLYGWDSHLLLYSSNLF